MNDAQRGLLLVPDDLDLPEGALEDLVAATGLPVVCAAREILDNIHYLGPETFPIDTIEDLKAALQK